MHGLSIYEIKMICHHAELSHYGSYQHLTIFLKITEILNIKLKTLSSPSFFILILIIAHDLKLSRKCEKELVFPSRVKILHDIFW